PRVHRAELAASHGAERLEDGAVEDVRSDGVRRLEAEHDHEDWREQRAAAHAGETDERADQQPRERELPGHLIYTRRSARGRLPAVKTRPAAARRCRASRAPSSRTGTRAAPCRGGTSSPMPSNRTLGTRTSARRT